MITIMIFLGLAVAIIGLWAILSPLCPNTDSHETESDGGAINVDLG